VRYIPAASASASASASGSLHPYAAAITEYKIYGQNDPFMQLSILPSLNSGGEKPLSNYAEAEDIIGYSVCYCKRGVLISPSSYSIHGNLQELLFDYHPAHSRSMMGSELASTRDLCLIIFKFREAFVLVSFLPSSTFLFQTSIID
jgi:hypothetical protein